MNYNTKDIFLERATATQTFEEYKLTARPSSVVITDAYGNLAMVDTSSFLAGTGSIDFAVSSSYSLSASYAGNVPSTASHAIFADTASMALSVANGIAITASAITVLGDVVVDRLFTGGGSPNGVFLDNNGDAIVARLFTGYGNGAVIDATGGITASRMEGTSSWADNAVSASRALSASHADISDNSGMANSASYALSATFCDTASVAFESTFADTASIAAYSNYAGSSSYAFTASLSAYANNAGSSSYAFTASVALNVPLTASNANTASFSFNAVSASYAPFTDNPNAVSASWASSSISSSASLTASSLIGWNFVNTSSNVNVLSSNIPVVEISTGSYNSAFFDYVALSGSNCRAGIVFGSWVNGFINYTEVSNVDVGDTSKVTMSLALNGGNIQLLANTTNTIPWNIKALGRYI